MTELAKAFLQKPLLIEIALVPHCYGYFRYASVYHANGMVLTSLLRQVLAMITDHGVGVLCLEAHVAVPNLRSRLADVQSTAKAVHFVARYVVFVPVVAPCLL